jgi:hypothetical protein
MKWMSQQHDFPFQAVTCCSTDDCNAPDPALDKDTQIIGTARFVAIQQQCPHGVLVKANDPSCQAIQFKVSAWEASPFPEVHLAFVSITDVSNVTNTSNSSGEQQPDSSRQVMRWKSALLPLQPAAYNPPAAWNIPAPLTVTAAGGGVCAASLVPIMLFGGTVEFYVHVEPVANGKAWLVNEVWGVKHADVDSGKSAGFFGANGYSRNVVKFITAVPFK